MTEIKDENADTSHISRYFPPFIVYIFKNSFSLITSKSEFLKPERLIATSLTRNLANCSLSLSPSTKLIHLFLNIINTTRSNIFCKVSGSTVTRLIGFRQAAFRTRLYCKEPLSWIFLIIVWSILRKLFFRPSRRLLRTWACSPTAAVVCLIDWMVTNFLPLLNFIYGVLTFYMIVLGIRLSVWNVTRNPFRMKAISLNRCNCTLIHGLLWCSTKGIKWLVFWSGTFRFL